MRRGRVTPLDNDEALTVCERIKANYPDILERREDGLYRHQLGSEEIRQVLFDYLACQRTTSAPSTSFDHLRLCSYRDRRCLLRLAAFPLSNQWLSGRLRPTALGRT